jgi:hypothetical protein
MVQKEIKTKRNKVLLTHPCNKESEIAEIHTKVNEMHHVLCGNGRPGLVDEFNQAKGALAFLKWGFTITGITGMVAILKAFL